MSSGSKASPKKLHDWPFGEFVNADPEAPTKELVAPKPPTREWIDAVNAYQAGNEEDIEKSDTFDRAMNSFINIIIDLKNAGYSKRKIKYVIFRAVNEADKIAKEQANDDKESEAGDGSVDISLADSQ
ncbi:hypothetical protein CSIM01_13838 [Colletotrichum simmondsii]|uniref:Uncharacterized protein n=1 Tax=Colletotrichum simmondsii TaxID=703756 RepID=A0A135RQA1_9PEZI|nr:hypothetical protein CSIM01_13838 [Colletotrichum simmondsii]